MLLVIDEASGVPEVVFEASAGSLCRQLTQRRFDVVEPYPFSGTFFESHNRMRKSWWTRRWSCQDSPLVAKEFIDEMRDRYGENSSAFMVRVMGEFPLSDDDTIIPFHLVEAAQHRDIEESPETPMVWALTLVGMEAIKRLYASVGAP